MTAMDKGDGSRPSERRPHHGSQYLGTSTSEVVLTGRSCRIYYWRIAVGSYHQWRRPNLLEEVSRPAWVFVPHYFLTGAR